MTLYVIIFTCKSHPGQTMEQSATYSPENTLILIVPPWKRD